MFATLATLRDIALGASPKLPGDARYALDSVTAEELTAAIASDVPGARVTHVRTEHDSSGTTDRARLYLTWNEKGTEAGLPTTAFAKGTPGSAGSRIIAGAFGLAEYESRFYQQIHPEVAEITLNPYVVRLGRGGRYVVALEDASNEVHFYGASDEFPASHAEGMIDTLATLHARFWQSPRFSTDLAWVQPYHRRPGAVFGPLVRKQCEKKFMEQDRDVPDTVRRLTRLYIGEQPTFDAAWEKLPATLVHGDCHLGNTYTAADGTAGIYDWQNLHKTNGVRDFAYFMTASVPTELRRAEERNLMTRYLERLAENGVKDVPSFDQAFDTYRAFAVMGWIAALTTAAIGGMQDEHIDVNVDRAIAALVELDTEQALRASI